MKLLKNRKFAVVITVIVVVLSTLLGVGRSLNRLAANTESMFYEGVYLEDRGFLQPPLNAHLENLTHLTLDIATTFANHPDLSNHADSIRYTRRSLSDATGIDEKFTAFAVLCSALHSFFYAAGDIELDDTDSDTIALFSSAFTGMLIAIAENAYNSRADTFMDEVPGFSLLLSSVVSVTPPQTFGPFRDGVWYFQPEAFIVS